ncbi:MAG: hypothetical protein ACXWKM_01855 [Phenylobacterium sp.]
MTFVGAGFFCLPTVLQIERLAQRAETLQVMAPASPGGAHGAGSSRRGARPGRIAATAPRPFYGALREAPPSELETLSSLRGRAASVPARQDLEAENPQVASFAAPAAAVSPTAVSFPGPSTPSFPSEPGTLIGGPPPVTPPTTPSPPVIVPPIVIPPVVTPPTVTPPTVIPVVTPSDNPPVVTPLPPLTPDNPPIIDPYQPPIDGGGPGPGGPGPGNPGPGDPGPGGGPSGAVPEPSVWMELILGAGLAGAALRRGPRFAPA